LVKQRMTKTNKPKKVILLFIFMASFLLKFYFFDYKNLKIYELAQ